MLKPMGLPDDVTVIAWGLSVERWVGCILRGACHCAGVMLRLATRPKVDCDHCAAVNSIHLCLLQAYDDQVRLRQHSRSVRVVGGFEFDSLEPDVPHVIVVAVEAFPRVITHSFLQNTFPHGSISRKRAYY